jgi:hypothetical protein
VNVQLLARTTTTALILEAVQRFGPLSEREIGTMLDESLCATSAALSRLLLSRQVRIERTAQCDVVLYAARGGR